MSHLERAGIVTHRVVRRRKVWRAAVDKADMQRSLVADLATLADRLFEGDVAALVCQLVQTRDANAKDLGRVIALLQARERELERNGR